MSRHALALSFTALVLAACSPDTAVDPLAPSSANWIKIASTSWAPAASIEVVPPGADPTFNTAALEGCPFAAPDGRTFFFASNRPGGLGGIDIYVSTRRIVDDPWGAPVNVGAPVNSPANEFCPTLARDGHTFYFVSNRPGGCGGDDIYVTRRREGTGFEAPENLGCRVNSAGDEASPFPIDQAGTGLVLYFSSTRAGGPSAEPPGVVSGDADIYMSDWHGGAFGRPTLVPGVNSTFNDGQPNLRRDALEIFFFSNRPGTLGGNDIYSATRAKARDVWSTPFNLGPNVNSSFSETRPSLTWDGGTLYFGSTREGSSDIYVTSRQLRTHSDD